MNKDNEGEIINGIETYKEIADQLKEGKSVIVGWTDLWQSHYDILFTVGAERFGIQIQGGIRPATDLFVSIMRQGSFAFAIDNADTHPSYINEKFNLHLGMSPTTEGLADLINGVKKELIK